MTIAEQVVAAIPTLPGRYRPFDELSADLRDALTHVAEEEGYESRWEMRESHVYRAADGSYVRLMWSRGLTEEQDDDPDPEAEVVEPAEVTVVKYQTVKHEATP